MMEAFEGDGETFAVFFRLCRLYKVEDFKKRVDILRKLVARKRLKYHRDGAAILKGKKIGGIE